MMARASMHDCGNHALSYHIDVTTLQTKQAMYGVQSLPKHAHRREMQHVISGWALHEPYGAKYV